MEFLASDLGLGIPGFAASEYAPQVVEHVPGIDNIIPDELSRQFQPGHHFVLPSALAAVDEMPLVPREAGYFKTVTAETATPRKPREKKPRMRCIASGENSTAYGRRGRRQQAAVWVSQTPNRRKLIKLTSPRLQPEVHLNKPVG